MLKPFWIYWGILISGCILFFICPLVFVVFLPLLLIIILIWLVIVYMIGAAVQQRSGFDKIYKRIALSALCSCLVVVIFPVCSWIYDTVKWNELRLESFINNFKDLYLWILFALHFSSFWLGEEISKYK